MTWGMHAIGYKDLHMLDQAAKYFNQSFQDNTHAPFNVWTETPSGNAGNFLHTLTQGYSGIRIQSHALNMTSPTCPEGTSKLTMRGMGYLGAKLTIS